MEKLWELQLKKLSIDETSNKVNFCFMKIALNKSSRIKVGGILILIQEPVISNYFSLSSLFFTNT